MPTQTKKFTRKHYFIAPGFQLRYIRVILLVMFGAGALAAYTVYYQTMILFGERLASVYPQGRLMAIVKSINIQILFSLLLITPLLVVIGIFLSHRIAGPIYRMERFLGGLAKGDIANRLSLRKKDELKSLADGINIVVAGLRDRVLAERQIADKLRLTIRELEKHSADAGLINSLKEEIASLEKSLSSYKV
ncbi:MAG: hypothetical protein A2987_05510 [Omnitrophica bacterium RIFCSPLOWO2_01_FULL_45_10]|nr:MAG: hypothetical protein A2987_05510 [Omnitrophica bacterium RIFCSPLOWO2_01_FULL_45_10]